MQITELKLKNFKKFQEFSLGLKPGINVVYGENEKGKSTLLSAIITALYVDPSTRSKVILDRIQSWKGGGILELSMQLIQDGNSYEIKKDFSNRTAVFANLKTGKKIEDVKMIEETIAKLTMIPTAEIYRSTALVRQKEMARVETSADLRKTIQDALTGTEDANVDSVNKKVDSMINDLTVGLNRPAKNPGRIKTLQDKIMLLEQEYTQKKQSWEKLIKAKETGKASTDNLGEIDRQIEILEKLMENQKKNEDAQKDLKQVDGQIRELERLIMKTDRLSSEITRVEAKLQQYKSLNMEKLEQDIVELANLEGQIKTKERLIENTNSSAKYGAGGKKQSSGSPKLLFPAGLTLIILSVLGLVLVDTYFLALLVVGLAMVVYSSYLSKSSGGLLAGSGEEKARLAEIEASLARDKASTAALLAKYRSANRQELYMKKLRLVAIIEEKNKLEAEIRGVLSGKSIEEIKEKQLEFMTKKKQIEQVEMSEEVRRSQMGPQEYLSKRRELDSLRIKKRTIERQQVESEVRVEDSEVNYDTMVNIDEQLESSKNELEESKFDLNVLELIKEALASSTLDLSAKFGQAVIETMKQELPLITNGRYQDVKVDNDFGIKVFSQEKNDWVDPSESLSAGTIDQIFFLYRLALLKSIERGGKDANSTHGANTPILLDDPFVTFDGPRLEETRKILQREAEERQIILFTHNKEYKGWGNFIEI
ncbi:MAG: Lantibiotic protection ABC superfamily ATP binding cassette transporter [candidate division WS6 bacterium GW2011_GWA2_37_6]|uniref:Lantibiotic protection ABC superfamily ATP binding cassette transporter n=1 Tax=candidate division WS6 bacterium GW2011_GWA2_37_6 TaxID=1619087 RepID=A0A0G0K298_9BACT|nr:MAG: Lantibiotic protection ABC superfamily ATP binding cassette transporter [candidate division WS6 bacterium GW2011_GWA2_37_6]